MLLFFSIQENVRSTTHLLGKTWKPSGGSSFCQSTATPSLAHSLAQDINSSLGAGFFGRSTRSTLHPRVFSVPSPRLCPPHGSPPPATAEKGGGAARPLCAE